MSEVSLPLSDAGLRQMSVAELRQTHEELFQDAFQTLGRVVADDQIDIQFFSELRAKNKELDIAIGQVTGHMVERIIGYTFFK